MKQTTHKISWVVFDLGGIVVPECGDSIDNEMAGFLNLSSSDYSCHVRKYERALTLGKTSLFEMYSNLLDEMESPFAAEELLEHHLAFYRKVSTPHNSEVLKLIEILKSQYGVACLTNTEIEIAAINRETGLFTHFHKAFLSTELGMQKPDQEIYEKVMDGLGCSPAEVIFIDDKFENVRAAKRVGMNGILFRNVEQLKKELDNFRENDCQARNYHPNGRSDRVS